MPERIHKLQPNRTIHLRGFNQLGAAAALHSATADSFKVSGVFRDPADFAVLMLYEADNFFEHPRLKYLPDFNFDGLTLSFDVHYQGLIPLDSPSYPTIDWPYLDVTREDGTSARIPLFDHAVQSSGTCLAASASFEIEDNGVKEYDRLTLWYMNLAFDYIAPKVECSYLFVRGGTGTEHTITVDRTTYRYTEAAADTDASIAAALVARVSVSPKVRAAQGDGTMDKGPTNLVNLHVKQDDGATFTVSATSKGQANGSSYTLVSAGAATAAAQLAQQVNEVDWVALKVAMPLRAVASGSTILLTSQRPGSDGNRIAMYSVAKSDRLRTKQPVARFQGGCSDAVWRISLNFAVLEIPRIRAMWLTFAPALADGTSFTDAEWEAAFTNWTVSGPDEVKYLQVAGTNSVRIEEDDSWCKYTGDWQLDSGFYSQYFARATATPGNSVTVSYSCQVEHDLYLGTSLYMDRGIAGITLDGDAETQLDCYLDNEPAVVTRRRIRTKVPPGQHKAVITLKPEKNPASSGTHFYLDFLEAVAPSDVPDALPLRTDVAPALDYSTDHTYKLPPARLMWNFDQLGFGAPMNEYIGVFWWNQRKRSGSRIPSVEVSFQGFQAGDAVFLDFGKPPLTLTLGKSVFPGETGDTIASHFACYINETSVALWAAAGANKLTITARSSEPAFRFPFSVRTELTQGSAGTVVVDPPLPGDPNSPGPLEQGDPGTWEVDPSQTPPLNRGAIEWHKDLFTQCAARQREITVSTSMELVNPPAGFAAMFPDGKSVQTDVGFGSLNSTHCAFVPPMLEYKKAVYGQLADLMASAGLIPNLQFGEFLWWFFTNRTEENPGGGMAFYDDVTKEAARQALGRPLYLFTSPDDDPSVNGGTDALFLRNRLRDHVADLIAHVRSLHSNARFEVLFPYDVNHPVPTPVYNLGGRLNRFINLPSEWEHKETSGLDRLKVEALNFGAYLHNLDLAESAIRFPLELGWPRDSVRYLMPVFTGAYPWEKECGIALGLGIPVVNLWAFDHVAIYGWRVTDGSQGRSVRFP